MKKVNLRRLRDVFILCLLLCATGAMAQERQIKGQVVDPQGAPLPGVSLPVANWPPVTWKRPGIRGARTTARAT